MPRNDQITRQWQLLRRLEGSNGLTLPQLVDSVSEDFPKHARTVRRKKYPVVIDKVTVKEPVVKEAKAQPYGREE
ncbi:MAG: hypothetical protein HY695_28865 [Deltaproteobacteria bacterium]|nr:hypothetical protein [Deltaproteobacteria bacterium]